MSWDVPETAQQALVRLIAEGWDLELVRPKDDEILLDFDNSVAFSKLNSKIDAVNSISKSYRGTFLIEKRDQWKSKSGNDHAVVAFQGSQPSFQVLRCIALFLGSDPQREMKSLVSYDLGFEDCSVLFKPKS